MLTCLYPNLRFDHQTSCKWQNSTLTLGFLSLSSLSTYRQTLQCPTMSFISALLQQTIYLGMPDDSVCNPVPVFLLILWLSQTACSPLYFSSSPLPVVRSSGKVLSACSFGARH